MERTETLKDGREVVIRDMRPDDVDRSHAFFLALPEDDRTYLRVDVTHRELVQRRIEDISLGRVRRVVAVQGEAIVADGALELDGHGWGRNIAEVRLIVGAGHRHVGLGTLVARELYLAAAGHRVDRIVARLMRPQQRAHSIFKRLGFRDEFLIPEHVRDLHGVWQDLIIMRCNLADLWIEMEQLFEATDWRRAR